MKINNNLDLNNNQLLNAVLENIEKLPEEAVEGSLKYDTELSSPVYFNGTEWVPIGDNADTSSITHADIDEDGNLILTLSDERELNCGHVVGSDGIDGIDGVDGTSVINLYIDEETNHLICILSDDTVIDCGEIPSGGGGSTRLEQFVFTNEEGASTLTNYATKLGCTSPGISNGAILSFSSYCTLASGFCNSTNNYALNFDYTGTGGWAQKTKVCTTEPVYLNSDSQIVLKFNAQSNVISTIDFVLADSDSYSDIFNGEIVASCEFSYMFTSTQNVTFLLKPTGTSGTIPAGNYYVIFNGVSDNSKPIISELIVYTDVT